MLQIFGTNKKSQKILLAVAILFIVAGAAFYFGGKRAQAKYSKEAELNVKIHRSDMAGLGKIEGSVYVTGHKSPDSDTVTSAIAYAGLLQKLGYDAHAVTLGKINRESEFILKSAGVEEPPVLGNAAGRTMVLVDHSEFSQSADGLKDAKVISIIDHHNDGSITTNGQIVYDARPLGSTATIVWIRYRDYGIEYDKQTAKLLAGGILSDTKNFQSEGTSDADRIAFSTLSKEAGITDRDSYYKDMYKAKISYGSMTDSEVFFSDYKEYEVNKTKFSVGVVNAYDEADAKDLVHRMKAVMPEVAKAKGMKMAFAIVSIFHDEVAVTYLVGSGKEAEELLKKAFAEKAAFSDGAFILNEYVSRKRHFIPVISDELEL